MPPPDSQPWWVILNPRAGNGLAAKKKKAIERHLQKHRFDYQLVETQHPMHASELVRQGIESGFRQIMGVGGDGTNHEIVNGIMQQQLLPPTDLVYTLLAVGTGNDWIKTHGIPASWKNWIPRIARGKAIYHDVGLLTYQQEGETVERYFANVAGLAYDAYVVRKKEASSGVWFPKMYYLWMVVRCLFEYRLRKATVSFGDQKKASNSALHKITDHFYTINIGIGRYSGGGMQLVPHADPTSGQLALTVAGPVQKMDVLLYTPSIFAGTLHRHPKVNIYHTQKIEIKSEEENPTLLEADGEFLGHTPVTCCVLPQALKVLVPDGEEDNF